MGRGWGRQGENREAVTDRGEGPRRGLAGRTAAARKLESTAERVRQAAAASPVDQEDTMRGEYTAVIEQEGDWWIGWIEEVPGVNCQERTPEELTESLQVTLREALDLYR
jgi:hypothetical protein